jgi:hypothetical protein
VSARSYELLPFPGEGFNHPWSVTAHLTARWGILAVQYVLAGHLDEILIPPAAATPSRRDGLWEETCFELFLAPVGASSYWEINLSPAGHWNVYRFEDYRHGMREEAAIERLPFAVYRGSEELRLEMTLGLGALPQWQGPLEAGISAVIVRRDAEVVHWALAHSGRRADFHHRAGFIARVTSAPGRSYS